MELIAKITIALVLVLYVICIVCISYLLSKYRQNNVVLPRIVDYIVYPDLISLNDKFLNVSENLK